MITFASSFGPRSGPTNFTLDLIQFDTKTCNNWKFKFPSLHLSICPSVNKILFKVCFSAAATITDYQLENINPFKPNGISQCYQLDHSISVFRVVGQYFSFFSNFKRNLFANSGEPDQTPHFVASDLVFHCLPMSHKKAARLIWVN